MRTSFKDISAGFLGNRNSLYSLWLEDSLGLVAKNFNCVYYELKSDIFVEIDVLLTSGSVLPMFVIGREWCLLTIETNNLINFELECT
jgi:hypothetical protein